MNYLSPLLPMEINGGNVRKPRVSPVNDSLVVVNSQAIGPEDLVLHNDLPCCGISVHSRSFYLRVLAPVRPEHQPEFSKRDINKCLSVV